MDEISFAFLSIALGEIFLFTVVILSHTTFRLSINKKEDFSERADIDQVRKFALFEYTHSGLKDQMT